MIKPPITSEEKARILDDLLKPFEPVVENEIVQEGVEFNGLIWEAMAYRRSIGAKKERFHYNKSIERICNTDYLRHPSSSEYFALFCHYLDNKNMNEEQINLVKDISDGRGEFFCHGIKTEQKGWLVRKEKTLIIYPMVSWFPRDEEDYTLIGMNNQDPEFKVFKINDLKLNNEYYFKHIKNKHGDLIKYLTSRKFDELPEQIKDNGRIKIPELNKPSPIGITCYEDEHYITTIGRLLTSRGVRVIK